MGWMERLEKGLNVAMRVAEGMAEQANRQAGQAELKMARQGRRYDGLTMEEWEGRWENIGTLDSEGWRGIRDIGIYNIGPGLYIGRVIYKPGSQGMHWRLQQYTAGSSAGNTTESARSVHAARGTEQVSHCPTRSEGETKVRFQRE
ncbi:MAG: hypothetical protein OXP28_10360, partial [Gammaproteobacteria bacterium]|nr:hypothetical protein [Gammaproteobacteria bacterium]